MQNLYIAIGLTITSLSLVGMDTLPPQKQKKEINIYIQKQTEKAP